MGLFLGGGGRGGLLLDGGRGGLNRNEWPP